jgi:hypothetical protein
MLYRRARGNKASKCSMSDKAHSKRLDATCRISVRAPLTGGLEVISAARQKQLLFGYCLFDCVFSSFLFMESYFIAN